MDFVQKASQRNMAYRVANFARRFRDDEAGGIIILGLLLLISILVAGGMAVDFMHNEYNRIYLQGVADRAVISGASLTQEIDGDVIVQDFFEKAGVAATIVDAPEFEDTGNTKTVSVEANNDIPTFFLRFIGIDDLSAVAASSATEGIGKVEISLVVDVSMSMKGGGSLGAVSETNTIGGRIHDMRVAAKAFADVVLDPDFDGQVSLNIIPFAGQVNPGRFVFEELDGDYDDVTLEIPYDAILPGTTHRIGYIQPNPRRFILNGYPEIQPAWVDFTDADTEDDVPIYLYDSEGNPILANNGTHITNHDIGQIKAHLSNNPNFDPDRPDGPPLDMEGRIIRADPDTGVLQVQYTPPHSCLEMLEESDWTTSGAPAPGQPAVPNFMSFNFTEWEIESGTRGWGWCPDDETRIKYAMETPGDVASYLASLTMFDGTGTDHAMKWGLATLDPEMRPIFARLNDNGIDVPDAFANRPADYDDPDTQKIIVLMTDGGVTGQQRPIDDHNVDPQLLLNLNPTNRDVASAWLGKTLADLGWRDTTKQDSVARTDLLRVCSMAKAREVEVFTVAFEYGGNQQQVTNNENVMRNCATPNTAGRTYYYAAAGAELTQVFTEIAEQVSQLRLTQ